MVSYCYTHENVVCSWLILTAKCENVYRNIFVGYLLKISHMLTQQANIWIQYKIINTKQNSDIYVFVILCVPSIYKFVCVIFNMGDPAQMDNKIVSL